MIKKTSLFFILFYITLPARCANSYERFAELYNFICQRLANVSVIYETKNGDSTLSSGNEADISDNEDGKVKRITLKKHDKKKLRKSQSLITRIDTFNNLGIDQKAYFLIGTRPRVEV